MPRGIFYLRIIPCDFDAGFGCVGVVAIAQLLPLRRISVVSLSDEKALDF